MGEEQINARKIQTPLFMDHVKNMEEDGGKPAALPAVTSYAVVGETRWIRLLELKYIDEQQKERTWNMAQRTTKTASKDAVDAVAILAILKGGKGDPRTIIVRQFRPPLDAYTIEFPAGLIDKGETYAEAALRELKEETGYVGVVKSISPPCNMSPGLSDEKVCLVEVEIDMDDAANQNPKTNFDDGEFVETLVVEIKTLGEKLQKLSDAGDSVCAVVWSLCMGLTMR